MKTTLDLPDALIREVKLRAVLQRRTVKDLVAEFIRQGLGMGSGPGADVTKPPASPMVTIGSNGLPIIRCAPDAPAQRMTVVELLALEKDTQEEEDLQRAGLPL